MPPTDHNAQPPAALSDEEQRAAFHDLRDAITVVRAYAQLIQRRLDHARGVTTTITTTSSEVSAALENMERASFDAERSLQVLEQSSQKHE
ncbi:MAG: hypothetical protein ACR2OE_04485 [Thermomicrobiales bacterium]